MNRRHIVVSGILVIVGFLFLSFQNFLHIDSGPYSGHLSGVLSARPLPRNFEWSSVNLVGGRLTLATIGLNKDKPEVAGWRVRVLAPETIQSAPEPFNALEQRLIPVISPGSIRNLVYRDPSHNPLTGLRPMDVAGHNAVGFDPRFGENVFRVRQVSDCVDAQPNAFKADPRGLYECFRLVLYGPLKVINGRQSDLIPHRALATVVVKSFVDTGENFLKRLSNPVVEVATQDSPWMEIKFKQNYFQASEPLSDFRAYEMTVTSDSRFLLLTRLPGGTGLWNNVRYEAFTFNPRPWDPNSHWTLPVRYSQGMEYMGNAKFCFSTRAGYRESNCPSPQLLPLGMRYPIVARQLKMPDGSVFTGMRECSYPWISFDGEEMFCNMLTSSALAVVGRRTNWTWMLIDNSLNRVRERYTLKNQNGLRFCRDDEVGLENQICTGMLASSSLGMTSGAWPVPSEFNFDQLGLHRRPDEYLLTAAGYSRQVNGKMIFRRFMDFVGFPFQDEENMMHLSMNEMLSEAPEQRPGIAGTFNRHSWDLSRTPDTSGNFVTGRLVGDVHFFHGGPNGEGGVAAPYNDEKNYLKWQGSLLNFGPGSYVQAEVPASNLELTKVFQDPWYEFNLSFAIQLHRPVSVKTLIFEKPGSFSVWLTPQSRLEFEMMMVSDKIVRTKEIPFELKPTSMTGKPTWQHVNLRYRTLAGLRADFACHGDACDKDTETIAQVPFYRVSDNQVVQTNRALVNAKIPFVKIGPSISDSGSKIYFLDEVNLSKGQRSEEEIRRAQFKPWSAGVVVLNETPSWFEPLGKHIGLQPKDARVSVAISNHLKNPENFKKIACLGEKMFSDIELSRNVHGQNQNVSCASCHQPAKSYTDGLQASIGVDGLTTGLNAPTVVNRLFSTRQMFDQKATTLSQQAILPIINKKEMNGDVPAIMNYLNQERKGDFMAAFGLQLKEVFPQHLNIAIGAFMSTLLSGRSEFDRLLANDRAITLQANHEERIESIYRGYQVFQGKGRCVGCHSTGNFSDEMIHNTGLGRKTKTPTLREITRTAPYMHDGSQPALADVLSHYSSGGRTRDHLNEINAVALDPQERIDLTRFLQSLSVGSRPLESIQCQ